MTLGRPIIVTDDWLVFGVDVGNRVNVAVHATGQGDISAQLDVRVDASPFAAFLCRLAEEVDCLYFCPESEVIERTPGDLLTAIEKSQAAAFCEGPKTFLRKLLESC